MGGVLRHPRGGWLTTRCSEKMIAACRIVEEIIIALMMMKHLWILELTFTFAYPGKG